MTRFGLHYGDGTALKIGDRVTLGYPGEEFEVHGSRPEGVAIIANVTPGFKALGTSTVAIQSLTFLRRAEGAA